MSRTYKDRPLSVKAREHIKKGRVSHSTWYTHSATGWRTIYGVIVEKSQAAEIHSIRAKLAQLDSSHRVTEVEIPNNPIWESRDGLRFLAGYTPKKVQFIVEEKYRVEPMDEHVVREPSPCRKDHSRGVACCYPIFDSKDFKHHKDYWVKNSERAKKRAEVHEAMRLANSGAYREDLEGLEA